MFSGKESQFNFTFFHNILKFFCSFFNILNKLFSKSSFFSLSWKFGHSSRRGKNPSSFQLALLVFQDYWARVNLVYWYIFTIFGLFWSFCSKTERPRRPGGFDGLHGKFSRSCDSRISVGQPPAAMLGIMSVGHYSVQYRGDKICTPSHGAPIGTS